MCCRYRSWFERFTYAQGRKWIVIHVARAIGAVAFRFAVISECRKGHGYRRGISMLCNCGLAVPANTVIIVGSIVMVAACAGILIFAVAHRTAGRSRSTMAVLTRVRACVIVLIIVCVEIVQVSAVLVRVSTIASKA